ncbi:hypothetical protein [Aeromonas allosaccharophila]|nr:hypothetical protein [Aeromonas allosaccharophila]
MTNSLDNVVKISELGAATQCGSHAHDFLTIYTMQLLWFKFTDILRFFM